MNDAQIDIIHEWIKQVVGDFQPELDFNATRARVERFLDQCGANVIYGGTEAHYRRASDEIHMPKLEAYQAANDDDRFRGWLGILFHELIHWTSHPKRLNRRREPLGRSYSRAQCDHYLEEVTAEIGAIMLLNQFGIYAEPPVEAVHYVREHQVMMERYVRYARIANSKLLGEAIAPRSVYSLDYAVRQATEAVAFLRIHQETKRSYS